MTEIENNCIYTEVYSKEYKHMLFWREVFPARPPNNYPFTQRVCAILGISLPPLKFTFYMEKVRVKNMVW